jgi:hypothetical protein
MSIVTAWFHLRDYIITTSHKYVSNPRLATADMLRLQHLFLGCIYALFLLQPTLAFYLPGTAPHDYAAGDPVHLFVNALTPMLSGKDDAKLVCPFA